MEHDTFLSARIARRPASAPYGDGWREAARHVALMSLPELELLIGFLKADHPLYRPMCLRLNQVRKAPTPTACHRPEDALVPMAKTRRFFSAVLSVEGGAA